MDVVSEEDWKSGICFTGAVTPCRSTAGVCGCGCVWVWVCVGVGACVHMCACGCGYGVSVCHSQFTHTQLVVISLFSWPCGHTVSVLKETIFDSLTVRKIRETTCECISGFAGHITVMHVHVHTKILYTALMDCFVDGMHCIHVYAGNNVSSVIILY